MAKGNFGPSWTRSFGDFSGGELVVEDGREPSAAKRCWHVYDGARVWHYVRPFRGTRVSVTLFESAEAVSGVAYGCSGGASSSNGAPPPDGDDGGSGGVGGGPPTDPGRRQRRLSFSAKTRDPF